MDIQEIGFGDFCTIEQKRYVGQNEFYSYKVVGRKKSNVWSDVPVDASNRKETLHDYIDDVVTVICNNLDDRTVYQFRVSDLASVKKAQAVPDGFVLVRKEPNEDQWGGFARLLGRYMQSHSRYCPSNLKKYIEHFESIPDWLNREVTNWESDHAFATADLPVFIYKAMIEAQEPTND